MFSFPLSKLFLRLPSWKKSLGARTQGVGLKRLLSARPDRLEFCGRVQKLSVFSPVPSPFLRAQKSHRRRRRSPLSSKLRAGTAAGSRAAKKESGRVEIFKGNYAGLFPSTSIRESERVPRDPRSVHSRAKACLVPRPSSVLSPYSGRRVKKTEIDSVKNYGWKKGHSSLC